MKINSTSKPAFIAADSTRLRELLHPDNEVLDLCFSLAQASLKPGKLSLPHRLLGSSETYYFLSGQGRFFLENEVFEVQAGDLIYVAPDALQWVQNTGTTQLEFLCIVSPPWSKENEEIYGAEGWQTGGQEEAG